MKKFMKSIQMMVALLVAVAATTACSNDDNIADEPNTTTDAPKTYTMTVEATMGDDEATTRALLIDGTGALNATWTAGDVVSVYKQIDANTSENYGTLTATNVSADGKSCMLTGELTSAPAVNAELTLQFNSGGYVSQKGTLDYIATHCDVAKATVTVASVTDKVITTTGGANFVNQQAIVKFTLKKPDGTPFAAHYLTVKYGGTTIKVTPDAAASDLYVAIPGNTAKVTLTAFSDDNAYTYEKSGVAFTNGQYYTVGVKMQEMAASKDLSTLTADYEAKDGELLTGTLDGSTQPYKVSIASGATVMLKDAAINGVHVDYDTYKWAGITCAGNATIILTGANTVKGFNKNYPGIFIPSGKTLTIKGGGSLDASSNGMSAGIGGYIEHNKDVGVACGNIRIEGGTVTATGGNGHPGIGSGCDASCGDIIITGGTVTANGGLRAAGIGSGAEGKFSSITIGEGVTSVTATAGYNNMDSTPLDPIGKGYGDTGSGAVIIDGTTAWTAGTATEHLNFAASTVQMSYPNTSYQNKDVTRWTLTRK